MEGRSPDRPRPAAKPAFLFGRFSNARDPIRWRRGAPTPHSDQSPRAAAGHLKRHRAFARRVPTPHLGRKQAAVLKIRLEERRKEPVALVDAQPLTVLRPAEAGPKRATCPKIRLSTTKKPVDPAPTRKAALAGDGLNLVHNRFSRVPTVRGLVGSERSLRPREGPPPCRSRARVGRHRQARRVSRPRRRERDFPPPRRGRFLQA